MTTQYDVTAAEIVNSSEGFNDVHSGLDTGMRYTFKNFSLEKNDLYTEKFNEETGITKRVRASEKEIAHLLVSKISVSTVRHDTQYKLWYIYDQSKGCFAEHILKSQ